MGGNKSTRSAVYLLKSQETLASFLLYQLDAGGDQDVPNDVHEVDAKERKKRKGRLEKKSKRIDNQEKRSQEHTWKSLLLAVK